MNILATSVVLKCAELNPKTKFFDQLDTWCESEKNGHDLGCRPASCGQDIIATELIAAAGTPCSSRYCNSGTQGFVLQPAFIQSTHCLTR